MCMCIKVRLIFNLLDFVVIGKFCVFILFNYRIMVLGKLLNEYFIMIII